MDMSIRVLKNPHIVRISALRVRIRTVSSVTEFDLESRRQVPRHGRGCVDFYNDQRKQ
jgi:hypothetical protein